MRSPAFSSPPRCVLPRCRRRSHSRCSVIIVSPHDPTICENLAKPAKPGNLSAAIRWLSRGQLHPCRHAATGLRESSSACRDSCTAINIALSLARQRALAFVFAASFFRPAMTCSRNEQCNGAAIATAQRHSLWTCAGFPCGSWTRISSDEKNIFSDAEEYEAHRSICSVERIAASEEHRARSMQRIVARLPCKLTDVRSARTIRMPFDVVHRRRATSYRAWSARVLRAFVASRWRFIADSIARVRCDRQTTARPSCHCASETAAMSCGDAVHCAIRGRTGAACIAERSACAVLARASNFRPSRNDASRTSAGAVDTDAAHIGIRAQMHRARGAKAMRRGRDSLVRCALAHRIERHRHAAHCRRDHRPLRVSIDEEKCVDGRELCLQEIRIALGLPNR